MEAIYSSENFVQAYSDGGPRQHRGEGAVLQIGR